MPEDAVLERGGKRRPPERWADDYVPPELGPGLGTRAWRGLSGSIGFYLRLSRLVLSNGVARRLAGFCLVGLNGLVINTALFAAGTEWLALPYAVAGFVATQCATLCNYVLLEAWVFPGRAYARTGSARICSFFLLTNAAIALSAPLLFGLSALGVGYLLANLLSVGTLTLLRFAVSERWIWRAAGAQHERGDEPSLENFLKALHEALPSTASPPVVVRSGTRDDGRAASTRWCG